MPGSAASPPSPDGLLVPSSSIAVLERAFVSRITELKSSDPLAPVTVLVGANLQHAYLRRLLARSNGAVANVRFRTLLDIAGDLALMSARLPADVLPDGAQTMLLRHFLRQLAGEGRLGLLHDELPGLADAVLATLRDLRDGLVEPVALHDALPANARLNDINAIATAFREAMGRFVDRTSLFEHALESEPGAFAEVLGKGPVLCYGLYDATAAQTSLLERMAGVRPLSAYVLWSSTDRSLQFAGAFCRRLLQAGFRLTAVDDQGRTQPESVFFSASDRYAEAEEVVRRILDDLEAGVAPGDIAIVHHLDQNQDELISSILTRAGIPHYLAAGHPVRRTAEGRAAILLLRLLYAVPERASLLEFLSLPGIRLDWLAPGLMPRPAAWEVLTKQIGMVRGWAEFEALLRAQLHGKGAGQEPEHGEFERERVEQLLQVVEGFRARAAAMAKSTSWTDRAGMLTTILGEALPAASTGEKALDTIVDRLSMLANLDLAGVPCDAASFVEAAESAFRAAVTSGGYFQASGVFVGGVLAARFLRFSRVYLLECAERVFPPVIRQDPLLPDDERALINQSGAGRLPIKQRRADEERLLFELIRQSATDRLTMSYSRRSGSGNTTRLPSAFFLAAVAATAGEEFLSAEELEHRSPSWFRRLPARLAFQPAGTGGNIRALDESDLRRVVLEEHGVRGLPAIRVLWSNFERTNGARRSRSAPRFGEFDGIVGPVLVEQSGVLTSDLSASSLASYVACPYRFFLSKMLGLRSLDEPEAILEMGARERGTLVHHVLEDLVNSFLSQGESWQEFLADAPGRVDEIAARRVAALGPGVTGLPVIWEMIREESLADIKHYLEEELAAAREGWVPVGAEFAFEGVTVPAEGGGFTVRGRIDRLDQNDDRYRVVDYKTGGVWERPNGFRQGTSLQLPIYIRAAGEQRGVAEANVQAEYHYVARKGRFERIVLQGTGLDDDESYERVKSALRAGIASGAFFYNPGSNRESCRLCDFQTVCRERVARDFERKAPNSLDLRAEFNRIRQGGNR